MIEQTLIFRISCFKPGVIDPPRFQDFPVRVNASMSILDALETIRLEQDATLMYRHSCHHSCCGTCACKINGVEKLTCITNVLKLQTEIITLEPLERFHRKGDLVVEMQDFYTDIAEDWAYIRESDGVQSQIMPEGIKRFTRLENCIECGSCVSACPVVQTDKPFMGPAAMAAIQNELLKSPEKRAELLTLAGGERGERWCERALDCIKVCPTEVYPARHIADLRRALGK